jgi:hypothetical protein
MPNIYASPYFIDRTFQRKGIYDIRDYGAVIDGVTDDSAAVIAAIAACVAGGGGTVFFPVGRTLVNSQIVIPHDTIVPLRAPHQRPIVFAGATHYINGQSDGLGTGGSRLLLNYQGSGDTNDAKICTYGLASFTLRQIILQDTTAGPSETPFLYTTNTTLKIDDTVSILGTTAGLTCQQDGIVLGGKLKGGDFASTDAPFQGYGTTIEGTYFNNLRRAVYGRSYCSQIIVRGCFFDKGCGSNLADGACVEFDGSFNYNTEPAPNPLNFIEDNYIEVINYVYGIKLIRCAYTTVRGNGFQDGQTGAVFVAGVRVELSTHNYIHDNFCTNTITVSEDAGSLHQNDTSGPLETSRFINDIALNGSIVESIPLGAHVTFNTYSIPYATLTKVAYTIERFDTDQIHDNSTNNTRLTCRHAGYHLINYRIMWDTSTADRRQVIILKNNTTNIIIDEQGPNASGQLTQSGSTPVYLDVGDYVELQVYHTQAGGLNIMGNDSSEFSMMRLV